MLIGLLIVLGVNLVVVVAVAVLLLGRRRWLKRQPGEFAGAIRVSSGGIDGISTKWKRGSGRWVRDVLVPPQPQVGAVLDVLTAPRPTAYPCSA